MENVLIVSNAKSAEFFEGILSQNAYKNITTVSSCGEARRLLIEQDFDLCIVNAPLPDEFGVGFATHVTTIGITQVMLIVKSELIDEVSEKVEEYGVFTIAKPLSRQMFWSALHLANAAYNKMLGLRNQNKQLIQKMEDNVIINRAKCVLIQYLKITEPQAHKFIEKQAMDRRITRKQVAERILKTYES